MSMELERGSGGWTGTGKKCARGARRSSIRSGESSADGSNPLPHEDTAPRRHRNGAARAHLQSYPRHQHHGARTADRSDQDVAPAVKMSLLMRSTVRSADSAHARAVEPLQRLKHAGLAITPTAAPHLATSR